MGNGRRVEIQMKIDGDKEMEILWCWWSLVVHYLISVRPSRRGSNWREASSLGGKTTWTFSYFWRELGIGKC